RRSRFRSCSSVWQSTQRCFCSKIRMPPVLNIEAKAMSGRTVPLIGIPACVRFQHERPAFSVVERYPSAVVDVVGGLPLIIPPLGPKLDIGALLDSIDGLLLTGSPTNVEPAQYGGPPSREG